jgi:hypothetical protein
LIIRAGIRASRVCVVSAERRGDRVLRVAPDVGDSARVFTYWELTSFARPVKSPRQEILATGRITDKHFELGLRHYYKRFLLTVAVTARIVTQ